MISHHKKRGNGNGPDRVTEYILTHKCQFLFKKNQPMVTPEPDDVSDEDFTAVNPYHHQLNKGIAPEEPKDPRGVSKYFHIHFRMPANSRNLLFLLPEFSSPRLWQLMAQMKIQRPWIHKIAWATTAGFVFSPLGKQW